MALLSDAAHNFSDVLALIISYIARKLAGRESSQTQTYGYRRAEIFSAFLNSSSLIIISVALVYGGIERLIKPVSIQGSLVIWLAALSIVLNGLSVLLIKKEAEESINIRSAYLHLFTDMLTSVAVLAGGLAMRYLNWFWLDPVISLGIAFYLIIGSRKILLHSLKIMMQFSPENIKPDDIALSFKKVTGVKNLHHVHLWQLNENEVMFEAHVDFEKDISLSEFEEKLQEFEEILAGFGIHHFNIQPEFNRDDSKEIIHRH